MLSSILQQKLPYRFEKTKILKATFCFNYHYRFSSKALLSSHAKIHTPHKGIVCDICGTLTPSVNALKQHNRKVHEPKVPRQCRYCNKWYSSRWSMQRHVINMHVHADEEHRCEICGFVSSTINAKKAHIRYKHSGEKRHKCSMCEKAFKTPTLLKVSPPPWNNFPFIRNLLLMYGFLQEHTATHTGIDLYRCAYCEATFKSQSNRSTHYKRSHPTEHVPNMTRRTRPTAISMYKDFTVNSSISIDDDINFEN